MTPIALHDCVTLGDRQSWATFSIARNQNGQHAYRYALGRCWDESLPILSLVGVNPSTATHDEPDPTVKKCMHFARQEDCGGILLRNLFAWRCAHPRILLKLADPWGPHNEAFLATSIPSAIHVAAWGRLQNNVVRMRAIRSIRIVNTYPELRVFGWTESPPFEPRHPLFLRNATRLSSPLTTPIATVLEKPCPILSTPYSPH